MKSRAFVSLLTTLFLPACVTMPTLHEKEGQAMKVSSASGDAAAKLTALAEQYYEQFLVLEPLRATEAGDYRFNDKLPIEISEEWRTQSRAFNERYLLALQQIPATSLQGQDLLTRSVLQRTLQQNLEVLQHPNHLLPVDQFSSLVQEFAQLGSGTSIQPFKTPKDYDDFLSRVDGFTRWTDMAIENMERGVATGVVQPRVLVEKLLPQIQAILDHKDVQSSIFYGPVNNLPADFSATDKKRITAAYEGAIRDKIDPAYSRLHRFLKEDYLPKSRATHGRGQIPGGDAWYASLVRRHTTTSLSPEQIHQIGLREVARIHGEMEKVKREVRFQGDLRAFFNDIRENPRFRYSNKEQIVDAFVQAKEKIDKLTPRLFSTIPAADYEVRPVEPFREASAAGGSYVPATPDGSRPGVFYLNTHNPTQRTTPGREALSIHEGAPGHHFQISIQNGLTDLPRFRRFQFFTAYVEGWGLYAETLGKELGAYTDPYQYFGSLSSELWRSIRLILDTGLHAKGWTREQAIAWALQNSASTEASATAEVERFMAIPGQALAYKIGQLEITRLRREAERRLGERFDIKEFHRVILEDGSLPMDVLAEKTEAWIASR